MKLVKPNYVIESEIDGEKILRHIEKAARTCYKTEGKSGDFEKTKKFVRMLVKNGHHSTLEHYSISVRFIVSRSFTHELVRHRLCAYSQESTRYCDYSNERFGNHITYIIPQWTNLQPGVYNVSSDNSFDAFIRKDGELFHGSYEEDTWINAMAFSEQSYKDLINNGWKAEQARMVLPNSLKTEIVTTCNMRELMHIFSLRTSQKAHPEMREIMIPFCNEMKQKVPVLFDDIDNT